MKQIIVPTSAAVAVCLGYVGAGKLSGFLNSQTESVSPAPAYSEAKTDFISVAVFEGAKVRGYVSFRLDFSVSEAARIPEVGHLASDIAVRRSLSVDDINSELPELSKNLEADIRAKIESKLPEGMIKDMKIIDFGFDQRI